MASPIENHRVKIAPVWDKIAIYNTTEKSYECKWGLEAPVSIRYSNAGERQRCLELHIITHKGKARHAAIEPVHS
jgi:hypothetical protein